MTDHGTKSRDILITMLVSQKGRGFVAQLDVYPLELEIRLSALFQLEHHDTACKFSKADFEAKLHHPTFHISLYLPRNPNLSIIWVIIAHK